MNNIRKKVIIAYARMYRGLANNPKELAESFGYEVIPKKDIDIKFLKAKTYKTHELGNIILINDLYNDLAKDFLCIHELGHIALEHLREKYGIDLCYDGIETRYEYEANLFTVAYFLDDIDIDMPLEELSNYTLKTIIDKNLKLSKK